MELENTEGNQSPQIGKLDESIRSPKNKQTYSQ